MSTNWWIHISGGRFTYSQRLLEYQRFPNFPFSYCGVRELKPWNITKTLSLLISRFLDNQSRDARLQLQQRF